MGDPLTAQEQRQNEQQQTIDANQAEIQPLKKENEKLKQQPEC
jgi:hypothetical protein